MPEMLFDEVLGGIEFHSGNYTMFWRGALKVSEPAESHHFDFAAPLGFTEL